jgi:putative membrane protein
MYRHLRRHIKNFVNGSVYGATLIIPGISATVFAIILGFYDELISAVNRRNIRYLIVFLLGAAAGSVAFSSAILYLLDNHSFPTMLFFLGLLLGIVPLIASKTKGGGSKPALREILLAVFSLLALFALSRSVTVNELSPAYAVNNMTAFLVFYILLAGIINGATLVIPGLSGALILLIMGLYPLVIYSVSLIGIYIRDAGNLSLLRDICFVLIPFGAGALAGCLLMARLMEKLMRDYNKSVYAVILGLILGSAAALTLDPIVYQSGISTISAMAGAATFTTGCVVSYNLGKRD